MDFLEHELLPRRAEKRIQFYKREGRKFTVFRDRLYHSNQQLVMGSNEQQMEGEKIAVGEGASQGHSKEDLEEIAISSRET